MKPTFSIKNINPVSMAVGCLATIVGGVIAYGGVSLLVAGSQAFLYGAGFRTEVKK